MINIKEWKNSTCWLVLVVIVKLWFSVFLNLKSHIITHPRVTNDWAPTNPPTKSFDLPTATMLLHQSVIQLPPHQSVTWLAHCHHTSQSFDLPPATIPVSHLTCPLPPYQSFDLPPATISVSHLTCPLLLHHRITVSPCYHITVLLYQLVIWIAPCHHISQSFDLLTATTSVSHLNCPLPLHYCISKSLTCPLPQHQSVI